MAKVAVLGGSGYTGAELVRLLLRHPGVDLVAVTSREYCGQPLGEVFPSVAGLSDLRFSWPDPGELAAQADLVFVALPHQAAMEVVPRLLAQGCRVVDLSADFRFRDPQVYEAWYQPHTAPELLAEAVYGLPEIHRQEIRQARLVGNPGCYPTAVILGLAPLLAQGLVELTGLIADCKSGVTGAGRGLNLTTMYCEVNEGFRAYKVAGHRHTPEMEQELSLLARQPVRLVFTPHLVPMSRGILATIYAQPKPGVTKAQLAAAFQDFYQGEPFVRLCPEPLLPNTIAVRGSNYCDLAFRLDNRTGQVIILSAIDNLTRGASGQAVQNMNLMLGLPETQGLDLVPWWP